MARDWTQEELDEYPTVVCPNCDREQPDMDGFGFLFCEHCGHCKHPSKSIADGKWICDLCNCPTRSE
jgi:ribosomal protein L37AE/L43A